MRVIGFGLAVFLAVTAVLLYQVSSRDSETLAVAVPALPETVARVTPSPVPSPPPAIGQAQPTSVPPTATIVVAPPTSTATSVSIEPTVAPIEPEVVADEPVVDESVSDESVSDESVSDDVADTDVAAVEEVFTTDAPADINESSAHLAAVDTSDAWYGAIETPNGGRIGMVLSGLANVRAVPALDGEIIDELYAGWPVAIYRATIGDNVSGTDLWYQLSSGGYISAAVVGPFVPAEPGVSYTGNWVDIDLTRNIAVAYIDDTPVNAVIIITGKAGYETPLGAYTIFARRETDTLDSATVGIFEGDPEYYYLPNVPYVQYFAADGFAIHGNYWSDPWQFGTASSHGCINMLEEDAGWFWSFLDIGSVVNIHN